MEWPAKRCYVGLVAAGVQEQAEDILVPPLLRNCLTLMTFPCPSHCLTPQNSGPRNSFHCLCHSCKNVFDADGAWLRRTQSMSDASAEQLHRQIVNAVSVLLDAAPQTALDDEYFGRRVISYLVQLVSADRHQLAVAACR